MKKKVTPDTLSTSVEFDSPFRVLGRGIIETSLGGEYYAPEVFDVVEMADFHSEQWKLVNGYSGQDRYAGPVMHSSEYLGGGMAKDVLEDPGVYVITGAYYTNEDEEDEAEPSTLEGWVLAKYKD